ncbi:hypothetical protein VPH35_113443 [Triticum aestivum]|nr:leucine-rich repeat extensin-like protein 1 [Triticum aestivum]
MADSGDSSPHSAADDAHHHHHHHPDPATTPSPETAASQAAAAAAAAAAPPPPVPAVPAKVRLMVSYGGRIQPRPHDNQLSYVNGDTKILSVDRPLRFPDFYARLAGLAAARADLCVKYQLPGEDLDALVSVTNDEDLDHLLIEYDRLHLFRAAPGSGSSSRGGSTPRLRVFLFTVAPPPRPASPPKQPPQQDLQRDWYLDLKSASPPPLPQALPPPPAQMQSQQMQQQPQMVMKQETAPVQSPPPAAPMAVPQSVVAASKTGPDYLFGFDYGFMPPPAVKVKDPAGDPPKMRDNVPVEIPPKNEDRHPNPNPAADNNNNAMVSPAVSPAEFPRQIPDLDKLQLADNATQQQQQQLPPAPAPAPAPQAAPAPAPVVAPAAPVPAPLSRNGSDDSLTRAYPPATATPTAAAEYYVTKFPEKPPVPPPSSAPPAAAFLPVPGRYGSVAPGSGADPGPFFFIPAPPHGYYTSANPGGTSYYAVPHNNGNANGNGTAPAPAVSSAQGYPQVAYDSNGRAVYYTGLLPQYPSAVNGGGMSASSAVLGTEPSKPVAVKPTVS